MQKLLLSTDFSVMIVIGTGPADSGIFLMCIHLIPQKFQQVGIYDHAFHIL